jgi:hypothetical protein
MDLNALFYVQIDIGLSKSVPHEPRDAAAGG